MVLLTDAVGYFAVSWETPEIALEGPTESQKAAFKLVEP